MCLDRDLFATLRRREDIGRRVPGGRRDPAVSRQLLATTEKLRAFTLDRRRARLLRADGIAHVSLAGREPVGRDLGIAARALRGAEPFVGLLAAPLGIRALREDVPLRALRRHELLVEACGHPGQLCRGVALRALPRVDDSRESGQHEQAARRDHRTGAQGRCRGEGGRVVRRDEYRDPVGDAPATLRRLRIARCAPTRDGDRPSECGADRFWRRDAFVQPCETLWKRRQILCLLASRELGIGAIDSFAKRGGLSTNEREIAVDPLKLVASGAGALGCALRGARGLRDLLTSAREIGRDAASFALAFAPLLRQARGGRRKLLIARKEGPLLVAQAYLVALSDEMRAFGLDTRGPRFGEGDARSRRLLLGRACAVGGLASAARRVGGLFVDTSPALTEARELSG